MLAKKKKRREMKQVLSSLVIVFAGEEKPATAF